MGGLQDYEIAVLLMMYDSKLIGKPNYKSLQVVRSKIRWQQIAAAYKTKDSFDKVARKLVKMRLLSDDGKSMEVLYLDKFGVDFVVGHLIQNPNAMKDLESKMYEK
jgi:hypothetical protein